MKITRLLTLAKRQAGFTMIELLIVISILGILAVAVLSAINPLEQINRGRDTGTRSDAEQLLGAIDRFYAFQGYFPWEEDADNPLAIGSLTNVTSTWGYSADCPVLTRLSEGEGDCLGTKEIKPAFVQRLDAMSDTYGLQVYKEDNTPNTSLYVCFLPQSDTFKQEAKNRCTSTTTELPADYPEDETCVAATQTDPAKYMICLP